MVGEAEQEDLTAGFSNKDITGDAEQSHFHEARGGDKLIGVV